MRIVVALGGNALLKRGEPLTEANQRANVRRAAEAVSPLCAHRNEVIVTHGNGPQIGLLALQSAAGPEASQQPLDVLSAETEGMLGYLIEQELRNALLSAREVASILSIHPRDGSLQSDPYAEAAGGVSRRPGAAAPAPDPLPTKPSFARPS
jgi:carbamate kinase